MKEKRNKNNRRIVARLLMVLAAFAVIFALTGTKAFADDVTHSEIALSTVNGVTGSLRLATGDVNTDVNDTSDSDNASKSAADDAADTTPTDETTIPENAVNFTLTYPDGTVITENENGGGYPYA